MTDTGIRVNQHLAKTYELQHRLAANQQRLIEANAALCHAAAGWKAGRMDAEFLAAIAGWETERAAYSAESDAITRDIAGLKL